MPSRACPVSSTNDRRTRSPFGRDDTCRPPTRPPVPTEIPLSGLPRSSSSGSGGVSTRRSREYTARFPELADEIRDLFPALVMIERLKPVQENLTGSAAAATVPSFGGIGPPMGGLGDYRILREVGRGGMGVVYEAVQESLGRHVALKILSMNGRLGPTQLERFQIEARSAARLHHGNIVPVYGVGEHRGMHYYAMQFIQGHAPGRDPRRPTAATRPRQGTAERAPPGLPVRDGRLRRLDGRGPFALGGRRSNRAPPRAIKPSHWSPPPTPRRMTRVHHGQTPRRPAWPWPLEQTPGSTSASPTHRTCRWRPSRSTAARWRGSAFRSPRPWLTPTSRASCTATSSRPTCCSTPPGNVWVTDFGLAKVEGSDGPDPQPATSSARCATWPPSGSSGWSDRAERRLQPGCDALRAARPSARCSHGGDQAELIDQVIHDAPDAAAASSIAKHPARPGDDRPEGDRQGARRPVRRRPASWPTTCGGSSRIGRSCRGGARRSSSSGGGASATPGWPRPTSPRRP